MIDRAEASEGVGGPQARHHFRPPDPRDAVDTPTSTAEGAAQYPRPPRPWYLQVAGQWPLFATMLVVTVGLAVVAASYWRRGVTLVGAGMLLGALLRLVLPEKVTGLLCVRRRAFDVALMALLGAGILVTAWIVAPMRK